MFTRNIKDTFTANLLNAVSGVLGEAKKKKCSEGCECEACTPEETNEGCMPTNDMPSAKDRKTAGKLGDLLKRERDAKEKKEPNGVKTEEADMPFEKPYRKVGERKDEYGNKVKNVAKHLAKKAMKANEEVEDLDEKRGLWDNIHAKRKRIKAGSGEKMRKPGSEGAPTAADLKASANEAFEQIDELSKATLGSYIKKADKQAAKAGTSYSNAAARRHDFAPDTPAMAKNAKKFAKRDSGAYLARTKLAKEEVEELDEISKATMGRYINKAKDSIDTASYRQGHKEAHGSSSRPLEKKLSKRHKGIETAVKKLTKEDAEQIDEAGKQYIEVTHVTGQKSKKPVSADNAFKALNHYKSLSTTKSARIVSEDAEQIDELSKDTMGRYIKKAATKIGTQGVTAGLKIAKDERSQKNFETIGKRERGIATAVKKLTKEEQDFIDELNAADMDQIDELSVAKLKDYRTKARADAYDADDVDDERRYRKRAAGSNTAGKKIVRQGGSLRAEEGEITEARGRPKKAGARDFTIHPKTKEKLMHNNPEHMKRIERLQKNGILPKPNTEANQHIMQQLQRVKTSMRGGETVNFTHGDPTHVSGTHASKLLDKYAGMKPDEKEAFQKKIGHSHANLKSEL